MIDDSYTNSIDNKTIHNDLLIINLTRSDLNSKYYCHAVNPNFTSPIFTSITLDINCELVFTSNSTERLLYNKFIHNFKYYSVKPLDININLGENPLIAGRKVEFICDSSGSRPKAQITWFRDNRPLSNQR